MATRHVTADNLETLETLHARFEESEQQNDAVARCNTTESFISRS
ncbi:hypothetical protein [Pseudomonas sp.]